MAIVIVPSYDADSLRQREALLIQLKEGGRIGRE